MLPLLARCLRRARRAPLLLLAALALAPLLLLLLPPPPPPPPPSAATDAPDLSDCAAVALPPPSSPAPPDTSAGAWLPSPALCARGAAAAIACTPSGRAWQPHSRAAAGGGGGGGGSSSSSGASASAASRGSGARRAPHSRAAAGGGGGGGGSFLWGRAACAHLAAAGVRSILFSGDSYVRHAFQALQLVLTGDAERGSLGAGAPAACAGERQFDPDCRLFVPFNALVCNGSVALDVSYGGLALPLGDGYDAVVFGTGNHVDERGSRASVNDGGALAARLRAPCLEEPRAYLPQPAPPAPPPRPRVWLLGTHARLRAHHADETEARIACFEREAAAVLWALCRVPTLRTLAMTTALARGLPEEAARMSPDGVHWGRAVNVLKAQAILEAIGEGGAGSG